MDLFERKINKNDLACHKSNFIQYLFYNKLLDASLILNVWFDKYW